MADVFLSYAREDRETAKRLARALGARSWSIWWDREIIAGEPFDQVIERELACAGAVVVLWSAASVGSEWVKNETAEAAARNVLVPVSLDGVRLPLEFRRRQVADLAGWDGVTPHEGFDSLCKGIEAKVSAPAGPPVLLLAPPRRTGTYAAAAAVLIVALGAAIYAARMRPAAPFAPSAPTSTVHSAAPSAPTSTVRSAVPSAPAGTVPETPHAPVAVGTRQLADEVAGTYVGDVVSDAKGHSQSDVTVTITKLGARRVRISADYERLRTVEIDLERAGDSIVCLAVPSSLLLREDTLDYSPDGEVVYKGTRRR